MPTPFGYRYFLALKPPVAFVRTIGQLRDQAPFLEHVVGDHRLHLTLAVVGQDAGRRHDLAALLGKAIAQDQLAQAPVSLDRIVAEGTLELQPAAPLTELADMRHRLVLLLAELGLEVRPAHFRPHMTLGYRPDFGGAWRMDRPIRWIATEMVLIESHLGRHVHVPLYRWSLGKRAQPELDLFERTEMVGEMAA